MFNRMIPSALALVVAAVVAAAPAGAQGRSTIDPATLDAAAANPTPTPDARTVVSGALTTDAAVTAAGKLGLSREQLEARIASLDDESADYLSDRILAGGDTIVISATALIIILLLLILITK